MFHRAIVESMLASVVDSESALSQRWFYASCLLYVLLKVDVYYKYDVALMLDQRRRRSASIRAALSRCLARSIILEIIYYSILCIA